MVGQGVDSLVASGFSLTVFTARRREVRRAGETVFIRLTKTAFYSRNGIFYIPIKRLIDFPLIQSAFPVLRMLNVDADGLTLIVKGFRKCKPGVKTSISPQLCVDRNKWAHRSAERCHGFASIFHKTPTKSYCRSHE
jgi:hypothetical protein